MFYKQILRNITWFFEHTSTEKNSISTNWALNNRSFNFVIKLVAQEVIDFAKWYEKKRKICEENKSSSADENYAKISRTLKATKFIIFEISSRNEKSFKKLIKISFKLSKNSLKSQFKNKSESLNSIFLIFSQNSLQKVKNQCSKVFKNHKEFTQFIISFFVSNVSEMIDQH